MEDLSRFLLMTRSPELLSLDPLSLVLPSMVSIHLLPHDSMNPV